MKYQEKSMKLYAKTSRFWAFKLQSFTSSLAMNNNVYPSKPNSKGTSKFLGFPEEIPIKFIQYSEVISAVKPLLNFSRLCGVPGFSYFDSLIARPGIFTLLSFVNIVLLSNQVFLLILCLLRQEDFFRRSGPFILMRVQVILVHIWSAIYSRKLADALRNSPSLENRVKIYKEPSSIYYLRRKCLLAAALFVLLTCALSVKSIFIDLWANRAGFTKALEMYGAQCKMTKNFLFHPAVTSSYCFVATLASNAVWLFGDFLLLVLSVTLGEMYRRINRGVEAMEPEKFSSVEIDLVREHHGLTSKTVAEFDNAISVLNLINAALNTAIVLTGTYTLVLGSRARGSKKLEAALTVEVACKVAVAGLKMVMSSVAASVLNQRAHAALSTVRSWPMARDFNDFTLQHGRASVIHAFLGQLSSRNMGFTLGKVATITAKLLGSICIAIAIFFGFSRITISACSGRQGRLVDDGSSVFD